MKLEPLLFRILFLVVAIGFIGRANAAPIQVRIHGAAKITARGSRSQANGVHELVLAGTLTDDVGQPLAARAVTVRVTRTDGAHDPHVGEALRAAHGCDQAAEGTTPSRRRHGSSWSGVRASGSSDDVVATTDEDGRFCFRAALEPARYDALLRFVPTDASWLIDGATREISFDLSRRSLALGFDPTPHVLELDTPRSDIEVVALDDDDDHPHVAVGLPLVLANEREEIGQAVTDSSGRARFIVAGGKLGPPGPGELHVSFAGDSQTASSTRAEAIERHAKVAVTVNDDAYRNLSAGVPEDGIALSVDVGSNLGPLAEGSVEARLGDVMIGAAPVVQGRARLTLTFTATGNEALVKLRYVPASPWYEPLGEPIVRIPIRGPTLVSKVPLLLAGLAVVAFFLIGRISIPRTTVSQSNAANDREASPRLDVVRANPRGDGWRGQVVDAHDGTPIGDARVSIERGTFDGSTLLASVTTDAKGRFAIGHVGALTGGEEICAEARLHSRLSRPLPETGEIAIALAQRRRAMLAKLVAWARRRGLPFDARPEPTPGHVRRAAGNELSTARWAEAVEHAVFGPDEIDARMEHDIDRLAPHERPGHPGTDDQLQSLATRAKPKA